MTIKLLDSKKCLVTLDNGKTVERVYKNRKNGIYVRIQGEYYRFSKDSATAEKATIQVQTQVPQTDTVNHSATETIMNCIALDLPVYLYGPAGSGKNYTLQSIAEQLNLDFYFTNSIQQEYKVTGFVDAGGNYHETEFYKAFTQGGLFFLDEMDASIPEVLVLLNAAIANKYFEFPNGRADAHPDFRVVAAGNTIGSGANDLYTGRQVLDQATLDRFVTIEFDYDRNVELVLAKGNVDLVDYIRSIRYRADAEGIRATFSYRSITAVTQLQQTNLPLTSILKIAVFKGMDADTVRVLSRDLEESVYANAMRELVKELR